MKKTLTLILLTISLLAKAGITTYTFNSLSWGCAEGAAFISDKDGLQYDKPQHNYQAGVKVTRGYAGAGATSKEAFNAVRRITFNYATTTHGAGTIHLQIGNNTAIDTAVSVSTTNRDFVIDLPSAQSGKIKFRVDCTTNSIWLHSIAIRSQDGESSDFTENRFVLVTDTRSLSEGDRIIFGVADGKTEMVMGYYDENISQNNIHAIKGTYLKQRAQVESDDYAIYTLHKETGENNQDTVYIFEDELRYEQAYLVASGGKTKNKLTLWDNVVSPSYGNYGFWRLTIPSNGAAVIENAGTSERKYLQYNAADKLFGCYADPASQTKVCLYREVAAIGTDQPAIAASMINFGDLLMQDSEVSTSRTMEVNAIHLNEDITCTLKHGSKSNFTLNSNTLDRDGDQLTITFHATQAGHYSDTLILQSGSLVKEVSLLADVMRRLTIAEAVTANEFEMVYLEPVVVTKKYDKYIFIRDQTGSMLIYDSTNPTTNKPYGQGLVNGDVLSNIQGRFRNYFGVPELVPTAAWSTAVQKEDCLPEIVSSLDSTDVCRYIHLDEAILWGNQMQWGTETIAVYDAFNIGLNDGFPCSVDAIVYWDHDVLTLWIVQQGTVTTAIEGVFCPTENIPIYDILGRRIHHLSHSGLIISKGQKIWR